MNLVSLNTLERLLLINKVILPLNKICVKHRLLPSTWHYTLQPHAADLELFPWILDKKTQAKQLDFFFPSELETKLVHAAHTEKGKVLVRRKGPNDRFFPNRREKDNKPAETSRLCSLLDILRFWSHLCMTLWYLFLSWCNQESGEFRLIRSWRKLNPTAHLLEGLAVTYDDVWPETLHRDVLLEPAAEILDRWLRQQHHRSDIWIGHLLDQWNIDTVTKWEPPEWNRTFQSTKKTNLALFDFIFKIK